MDQLYRRLCIRPYRNKACDTCIHRVNSTQVLEELNLHGLTALIECLLREGSGERTALFIAMSTVTCTGKTTCISLPTSQNLADDVNIDSCIEMFHKWKRLHILTKDERYIIDNIFTGLYLAKTKYELRLFLYSMYDVTRLLYSE